MISVRFHGKLFNITVIQVYAPTNNAKRLKLNGFYEYLKDLLEQTQKRSPFHHRGLECKGRSQEIPGVTCKFGFGVFNETGQRLTEFYQQNAMLIAKALFQQHKRSTQGHHQMVNIETRLIRLFTVKDGDALYSQDKQDWSKLWLKS